MKKVIYLSLIICIAFFTGCRNNENEIVTEINEETQTNEETDKVIVQPSSEVEESLPNEESVNEPVPVDTDIMKETESPSTSESSGLVKEINIPKESDKGITVLKFKNTNSNDAIAALNGKKVSITGYLSTLSPLSGEFAYLMNMPYQNCPFCVPGTSEITNTLAIVAGNKDKIKFTDQPVTVLGTLETGNFTDEFGYQYGVRLNNVTVKVADVDELSDSIKKYNLLAENGVVNNIYGSIMTADYSIFYNYYRLEKPGTINLEFIKSTKASLEGYNTNGDYNNLVEIMNNLIKLCEDANDDIANENYTNFVTYQNNLQNIYYSFASWMAEGEL